MWKRIPFTLQVPPWKLKTHGHASQNARAPSARRSWCGAQKVIQLGVDEPVVVLHYWRSSMDFGGCVLGLIFSSKEIDKQRWFNDSSVGTHQYHIPCLVNVNKKRWKDPQITMLSMGKSDISTGPMASSSRSVTVITRGYFLGWDYEVHNGNSFSVCFHQFDMTSPASPADLPKSMVHFGQSNGTSSRFKIAILCKNTVKSNGSHIKNKTYS